MNSDERWKKTQEVIPNLHIGTKFAAVDIDQLKEKKIVAIINCIADSIYKHVYIKEDDYLILNLKDNEEDDLLKELTLAYNFLDKYLTEDKVVLVHCVSGISRSASIIIYYLMKKHKLRYKEAMKLLRSKRSCIMPNVYYHGILKALEIELFSELFNEKSLKLLTIS
jgi:protein-tyrosine phosphatase